MCRQNLSDKIFRIKSVGNFCQNGQAENCMKHVRLPICCVFFKIISISLSDWSGRDDVGSIECLFQRILGIEVYSSVLSRCENG